MTHAEADKILSESIGRAVEHFDSLIIIGSWTEGEDTNQTWAKAGNWYACIGMAHEFLESSSHEDLAEKLSDAIADKKGWEEDDDDEAV